LSPDADSQRILAELMTRGRVDHFELAHPSLHDIFVRIAGPQVVEEQKLNHEDTKSRRTEEI
jgi:ABC-type uncharacterized transport system ATPase subunit